MRAAAVVGLTAALAQVLVLLERAAAARVQTAQLRARLEPLTPAAAQAVVATMGAVLTAARVDLALSSCLFRPPSILAPQPAPRLSLLGP